MTKLFLALILATGSFSIATAQSTLHVQLDDNSPISVSVDGRYFNKRGTSITVGDLPPGTHSLRIYSIYRTRRNKAYEEIVYSGRVHTNNGMTTFISYDRNLGRVRRSEQESQPRTLPRENNAYTPQPDITPNSVYNQQPNITPDNNSSAPVASPYNPASAGSLTESETDKLKKKVNDKKTDTDKLQLLKDALKRETVTTYQVSDMMECLSFESSKVDIAKWAYDITVDKENYSDLLQKLSFKNEQDELRNFIDSKR